MAPGWLRTRHEIPIAAPVYRVHADSMLPASAFVPAPASPAQPGEVDRVYHQLREWLMDAVLPPGEFLSEPDLAQRCSTSRTPVREACMRLHQDRWLTRFPRKGFLVTPISVRDILDLYPFRKLLEGFAAEQVAPLQDVAARMMAALQTHEKKAG